MAASKSASQMSAMELMDMHSKAQQAEIERLRGRALDLEALALCVLSEVWALKIKEVRRVPSGNATVTHTIVPEEAGYAPFEVDLDYIGRHSPVAGGYYVVYKDGYKSFSPAGAFEEGYTRV